MANNQKKNICLAHNPKEDIINVLARAKAAALNKDYTNLLQESDHIIHCSTVYQNKEAVQTAVIVYALGKIAERGQTISMEIVQYIQNAIDFLRADNIRGFNNEMKGLLKAIGKMDENLSKYMQHIVTEARIKKGSRIYEHGISLRQTAEIFGLSQWELMKYVGKTRMSEYAVTTVPIKKRMEFARELFN